MCEVIVSTTILAILDRFDGGVVRSNLFHDMCNAIADETGTWMQVLGGDGTRVTLLVDGDDDVRRAIVSALRLKLPYHDINVRRSKSSGRDPW